MSVKLTIRVLRAIPLLLKTLEEDTPHKWTDRPERDKRGKFVAGGHPMYRRIGSAQEQGLFDLLTWLDEKYRTARPGLDAAEGAEG